MQLRCKVCQAVQMVSVADEADEDPRTQGIRRTFRAEHAACGEKTVTLDLALYTAVEADPESWNRYVLYARPPADVTFGADGFFYRVITRDGHAHSVRVCESCWDNIPRYIEFPAGLVSPESDGAGGVVPKLRLDTVPTDSPSRASAMKHHGVAVCLPCYLEAFKRVYPGADLPALNEAVVGDGTPVELAKEPEPVGRA